MKHLHTLLLLAICLLAGCHKAPTSYEPEENEWNGRKANVEIDSSFTKGTTYLSVHSQTYSRNSQSIYNLTVTVSMRNTSRLSPVYILSAEYFDTHGDMIRTYFKAPIVLQPMETVEIIISELDIEGGSGGNFLFDWAVAENIAHPIFDALMISTMGQQGISFITNGVEIK